jgi:hypothetical protein
MSTEDIEPEDERWYDHELVWVGAILAVVALVLAGFWAWQNATAAAQDSDVTAELRTVASEQNSAFIANGEYQQSSSESVSVVTSEDGWAALAESESGSFFMNASTAPEPVEVAVENIYTYNVSGVPPLPSGVSVWELVSNLLDAQGKGGFYTRFTLAGDAPEQTVFNMHPDFETARIESVEWEIAGLTRACATVTVSATVPDARWRIRMAGGSVDGFPEAYANRAQVDYIVSQGYGFSDDWYFERGEGYYRDLVGVLVSTNSASPDAPSSFRVCALDLPHAFPRATGEAVEVDGGWELRTESLFPRVTSATVPGTGELLPECLTQLPYAEGTVVTSCSNRPVAAGDPLFIGNR